MPEPFMEITSDHEDERAYATPSPHHRRPPPAKPNNGARFLAVVLKLLIMSSALFFFFLFAGIAAVIVVHLLIAGRSLQRRRRKVGEGRGMSREEVKRLPAFKFSEKRRSGAVDCAICLEKLREGERCRVLPRCGHLFHRSCVDRWIVLAPACPICRAEVRDDASQFRPLLVH